MDSLLLHIIFERKQHNKRNTPDMSKSNENFDDDDCLSSLLNFDFDNEIKSFINIGEDIVKMRRMEDATLLRKKKRQLVKMLSSLVQKIHQDNAEVISRENGIRMPEILQQISDSELKILQSANSTLESLIRMNKNLKKKRSLLKKKVDKTKKSIEKASSDKVKQDPPKTTMIPLNPYMIVSFFKFYQK